MEGCTWGGEKPRWFVEKSFFVGFASAWCCPERVRGWISRLAGLVDCFYISKCCFLLTPVLIVQQVILLQERFAYLSVNGKSIPIPDKRSKFGDEYPLKMMVARKVCCVLIFKLHIGIQSGNYWTLGCWTTPLAAGTVLINKSGQINKINLHLDFASSWSGKFKAKKAFKS